MRRQALRAEATAWQSGVLLISANTLRMLRPRRRPGADFRQRHESTATFAMDTYTRLEAHDTLKVERAHMLWRERESRDEVQSKIEGVGTSERQKLFCQFPL